MRFTLPSFALRGAPGLPNLWDFLAIPLVLGTLFVIAWGSQQMTAPYLPGESLAISLDPANLPEYALRTTLRMCAAMVLSLLFTFTYATLAAKSERAGMVLMPLLDVLQSVPILGFLSITVTGFILLFPGSMLGPEAASIFAIFTSQAWNMAFSFYHSLRMIPRELYHVANVFQLSAWQRFWKLEVPFALPALAWNAMISVFGGWFFVVASEAISVANQRIMLPGIGSYIALAIQQRDMAAIGYAIFTMLVVILLYDQLIFRPLIAWVERFKFEQSESQETPSSWLFTLLHRSRVLGWLMALPAALWEISLRLFGRLPATPWPAIRISITKKDVRLLDKLWAIGLVSAAVTALFFLARFVLGEVSLGEVGTVLLFGLATATRVFVLIVLASLFWVPIGVWVGMRPRIAQRVQPLVLFLSAFPANLLFPLVVMAIIAYGMNPEIWLSPLMILGTQWYILFNVIAGASAIPNDLREVAKTVGMSRAQKWRRLILPGIFPAYVTGGLAASGGAWNASVVAEIVNWGNTTLTATGLGAYIAQQTQSGDHPRIALGIAVMSLYVILFNRLIWNRLYRFAQERLGLE